MRNGLSGCLTSPMWGLNLMLFSVSSGIGLPVSTGRRRVSPTVTGCPTMALYPSERSRLYATCSSMSCRV